MDRAARVLDRKTTLFRRKSLEDTMIGRGSPFTRRIIILGKMIIQGNAVNMVTGLT